MLTIMQSSSAENGVFEHHFKPKELAMLWGFGVDTVRSWFMDEPGVLIEDRPEKLHKRGYRSMRIPESVARYVYAKHSNSAKRGAATTIQLEHAKVPVEANRARVNRKTTRAA